MRSLLQADKNGVLHGMPFFFVGTWAPAKAPGQGGGDVPGAAGNVTLKTRFKYATLRL